MPTEQVQHIVKHHRPALAIGAVIGLALIAGFVTFETALTPSMPIVQRASAAEVVSYISSDRGLVKLADIQQKQFLDEWQRRLTDTQARDELKAYLKNLDDNKRKSFVNALARQLKKSFLEDAKRFSRLKTPTEKSDLCRQKLIEGRDQAIQFKDIALSLKTASGQRTDDMQQWVIENTSPEERAIGEPYVDALKRVREQVKKEERVAPASVTKKPE